MALKPEIRLDVYSHNVKVTRFSLRGMEALLAFCRSLAEYGLKMVGYKKFIRQMLRVYASATKDRKEFRFHRNSLDELIAHLKDWGYRDEQIKIVYHGLYVPKKAKFTMAKGLKPRDYQVPIIEYMAERNKVGKPDTKIITLQTGRGKTYCLLSALEKIGQRVALVIKGMYVEKWVKDVRDAFNLKPGELMVVRGSKDLRALIDLAKAGELEAKFIIITNKTLYNYLKHYERNKNKDKRYGCNPEDLYKTLEVGVRAIDEVHQDFHLNFRLDLYSNVPKTISLSATMVSDDNFMNRMYEIMFDPDIRFKDIAYDKYIAVKALFYRASNIRAIRYMGKRRNYSHVVFEQSLLGRPKLLQKYLDMIVEIIDISYKRKKEPGQKMLIFCATVDMCTVVAKYLKGLYKDLDVRRYVAEDNYEDLLEADISVSTIKSAGTAVDIPDLRVCLLTDALSSRQANEQTVGRLRRLKRWPDTTPEFLYLVCEDIPQHIRYHNHKETFLADKVLSHKIYNLGRRL